jgi:hypothetical protein
MQTRLVKRIRPQGKLEAAEPGVRRGPKGRTLLFAEKKVNYDSIEAFLNDTEARYVIEAEALLAPHKEAFMKALLLAATQGDTDKLKSLTIRARTEYKALVKDFLRRSYEYGKSSVSKEMDVPQPPTPNTVARNIDMAAESIVERHLSSIETDAKLQIADSVVRGETVSLAVAAIDARVAAAITKGITDSATINVAGYLSKGRRTTMEVHEKEIYALIRSEVLDHRTCNYCLSIDARIIDKKDAFGMVDQFHNHCRGFWVEILTIEEGKPEITGVPDSLRDRFGGTVNDLIQPRTPITRKNTLARNFVLRKRSTGGKRTPKA